MGTRGAFGFKINNEYKLTYNHYDSYPKHLGKRISDVISNSIHSIGIEGMKQRATDLIMVSEDSPVPDVLQKKYSCFSDLSTGEQTLESWYCLLREIQGAETIKHIFQGNLNHMIDSSEFVKDSLFCEWAYVINLDTEMFEVYVGFQQRPQEGNPFGNEKDKTGYYPVALVCVFPLNNIPDNWAEEVESTDFDE